MPDNGTPDLAEKFADRLLELIKNQHTQLESLIRDSIKELESKDEKLSDRILALEQMSPRPGRQAVSGGVAGASIVAVVELFRQMFGGGL